MICRLKLKGDSFLIIKSLIFSFSNLFGEINNSKQKYKNLYNIFSNEIDPIKALAWRGSEKGFKGNITHRIKKINLCNLSI